MSIGMLGILGTFQNTRRIESKSRRGGNHENRLSEEKRQRCCRIVHWLLLWQTTPDCINNAFLVNGLTFENPKYLVHLYGAKRRSGKYKPYEKFHKYRIVKEMAKSGATFDEMYSSCFGVGSRLTTQNRRILESLIEDVKKSKRRFNKQINK